MRIRISALGVEIREAELDFRLAGRVGQFQRFKPGGAGLAEAAGVFLLPGQRSVAGFERFFGRPLGEQIQPFIRSAVVNKGGSTAFAILETVRLLLDQPLQNRQFFFAFGGIVVKPGETEREFVIFRVGHAHLFEESSARGRLTAVLLLLQDSFEQVQVAAFEGAFLQDVVQDRLEALFLDVVFGDQAIKFLLFPLLHRIVPVLFDEGFGGVPAIVLRKLLQGFAQGPTGVALLHLLFSPLRERYLALLAVAFGKVKAGK